MLFYHLLGETKVVLQSVASPFLYDPHSCCSYEVTMPVKSFRFVDSYVMRRSADDTIAILCTGAQWKFTRSTFDTVLLFFCSASPRGVFVFFLHDRLPLKQNWGSTATTLSHNGSVTSGIFAIITVATFCDCKFVFRWSLLPVFWFVAGVCH